jgi:hypothetical protein
MGIDVLLFLYASLKIPALVLCGMRDFDQVDLRAFRLLGHVNAEDLPCFGGRDFHRDVLPFGTCDFESKTFAGGGLRFVVERLDGTRTRRGAFDAEGDLIGFGILITDSEKCLLHVAEVDDAIFHNGITLPRAPTFECGICDICLQTGLGLGRLCR